MVKSKHSSIHLELRTALKVLKMSAGVSGMYEEEEGEDEMPDRSDPKFLSAARHAAFAESRTLAAGGEVDWPLNPAVGAASEPK
jgi:hypothetical protein